MSDKNNVHEGDVFCVPVKVMSVCRGENFCYEIEFFHGEMEGVEMSDLWANKEFLEGPDPNIPLPKKID